MKINDLKNKIKESNVFKFFKENGFQILKVSFIALFLVGVYFAGYFTHFFSLSEELRSVDFLIKIYKEHYYEPQEDMIIHSFADSILDQYSGYYTAEEYQEYIKSGQGSKSGYGIALSGLTIAKVAGNSPAEIAGIRAGGKVTAYKLKADKNFVSASEQSQLIDFLLQSYQEITLKIDYNGIESEFSFKRGEYLENYVYYSDSTGNYRFNGDDKEMKFVSYNGENLNLKDGWGYIKLTSFNGLKEGTLGSAGQFARALEQFKANGNQNLIIDLRNNGGGYLSILCKMASHLCDDESGKRFIVQKANYRDEKIDDFYSSTSVYSEYGFKNIIFLANNGSASASEALMGAVLDYDKKANNNIVKVIVEPYQKGEQTVYGTYGKGIMQSSYTNLKTGEAVKLTTAKVIWPLSGTCIHGVGLTPELDSRIYANLYANAVEYAQTLGG